MLIMYISKPKLKYVSFEWNRITYTDAWKLKHILLKFLSIFHHFFLQ